MFDVVMAFAVSYSIPYIVADIGPKIGFVFMGVCITGILYSSLVLPELAGRSLEEVDELFEYRPKLKPWEFKHFKTQGAGRRVADLELNKMSNDKLGPGEQAQADENRLLEFKKLGSSVFEK